MGWSQVGKCPHCGAPIYAPIIWHGVNPPPNRYTCNCRGEETVITTSNT